MNTTTIKAHHANLTALYRAKERLCSVRFHGQHHSPQDTEKSVLSTIRQLETQIARERKANLRHWVDVEVLRSSDRQEFAAWEPSALFQHSTFRTHSTGGVYGLIGKRPLPQDIEDMRGGSPERLAAVAAWSEAENREAWLAIVARYPEAAAGEMTRGRIVVKGAS